MYASQQCKNQLGKVNKIILELMCNELRKMLGVNQWINNEVAINLFSDKKNKRGNTYS